MAVTVKQLRSAAESMAPLQTGEDARPLRKGDVDLPMVRLLVQLSYPIMHVEPAFKMCIAGDTTGSIAFYFYPEAVRAEGRPKKRVLIESEDVTSSRNIIRADIRNEAHRRKHKFPMQPSQYYMVHGTPQLDSKANGLPATFAFVSVIHVRALTGDFNELTHHYLECIHHDLLLTHGGQPQAAASVGSVASGGCTSASSGAAAASKTETRQDDDMQFFFSATGDEDEDAASDLM